MMMWRGFSEPTEVKIPVLVSAKKRGDEDEARDLQLSDLAMVG
jgi:hypothetical protein